MSGQDARAGKREWWPWWVVLLVVVLVGAIRVRLLDLPLERDEGEYAYTGQLLLQGIPPFKLAYTMKLPGTTTAYALIMACFGQTTAGIHFGFLLVNAVTIVMVFLLGRKLLGVEGGLVAAATYAVMSLSTAVLGLCAHATHFVVLFAVAGVLTFLHAVESRRLLAFLFSGLLFGTAFLMKQPGLLFSFFGVFLIIWFEIQLLQVPRTVKKPPFNWLRCARRLAALCLGVALPYALVCVWLWRAGVFRQFWFWTATSAASYGSDVPGALAWDRLINRYFGSDCGPDVLFWLLAAVSLVLMWLDKRPGDRKAIILVLLVVSLLAVCPGFYFRQHYFVLALPALALVIGYGVAVSRRFVLQAGLGPVAQAMPVSAFALICLLVVVSRPEIFFTDSPAEASREMFGANDPFPEMRQIGEYIRTNTAKGDRIAVIGSDPEVSFYAQRRSVTGYIYTFNLMESFLPAVRMQKDMIREIETGNPALLVDIRLRYSWNKSDESDPFIFNWRDDYTKRFGDMIGVVNFSTNQPAEFHWGADAANYFDTNNECVCLWKRKAPP
jgi:hypothetical protein